MQDSQEVAKLIKSYAKSKNIQTGTLLSDCELSKNTLSSMQSGGYYPRIEAICKIADYLDCSVDYLLGRTGDPVSHKQNIIIGGKTMAFAARLREAMRAHIETLSEKDKEKASEGALYWASMVKKAISAERISFLIDGREKPNAKEIYLLSNALGVSTAWLSGEDDTLPPIIAKYRFTHIGDTEDDQMITYGAAGSKSGEENTYPKIDEDLMDTWEAIPKTDQDLM